jgi:hypothetical protein
LGSGWQAYFTQISAQAAPIVNITMKQVQIEQSRIDSAMINPDKAVSIVFAAVLKFLAYLNVLPRTSATIGSSSASSNCVLKTLFF